MYKVIARKWRPQQFEQIVGQQTVTSTLQSAIRQGRIAHAYLFTGTRGVGKTTTARILAKALNCMTGGPTPFPCDRCASCLEIIQGNSVDVMEIDAASNRGIGEIRELRENVQYAPSRDRYKIFIIDEVHMLTMEAFNALLKTLEEPPPHVVFILATTELYKIPQTIQSRCQQFDFRIVAAKEISDRLHLILATENFHISDQAIGLIVKSSGGSVRDAESALQKIISFGESEISDEDAAALLGVVRQEFLNEMMRAILSLNQPGIIDLIGQLHDKGHDLQNFLRSFIEYIRNITIYKITRTENHLITLSAEDIEFLKESAGRLPVEELIRWYELLVRAENELRWTPFSHFHVEMVFLKLAVLPNLATLEEIFLSLRSPGPADGDLPAPEVTVHPAGDLKPRATETVTRPAPAPDGREKDRLQLFLREVAERCLPLAPLLPQVQWNLVGDSIEIRPLENSFQEKTFQQPSNQESLRKIYQDKFGQIPQIIISPQPARENPEHRAEQKKLEEARKEVEELFRQDPVARILIDKLAGKWIFKR